MYGGFIVPADDDGASFGVLFWHKDGFSTACGHGTIALGVWALETGRVVPSVTGLTDVVIDVPSGRVTARVHARHQRITAVDFRNVASYVIADALPVTTSRGEVTVTISFGGAIYASVDAGALGLSVTPDHLAELIALGRAIKQALAGSPYAQHQADHPLSGIYVTVFADGEVDRSPCGSGTCARLAALDASGRLGARQGLTHDSIVGTRFEARILDLLPSTAGPLSFRRSPEWRTGPASTPSASTLTIR
jgi:proline racemase